MARETVNYEPLEFIAGSAPIRSTKVTIPAGHADVLALVPMKRNASFEAIPATALTDKIVGLTIPNVSATKDSFTSITTNVAAQSSHLYTHIDVCSRMVDFSAIAAADTFDKQSSMFDGTGISLVFTDAGQL